MAAPERKVMLSEFCCGHTRMQAEQAECVVVVVEGRLEQGFGLNARQAAGRMGRQTHTGDIPSGALLIGTDHKVSAMCHLMWDCKQGQNDVSSQLPVTRPDCDQQGATEGCRVRRDELVLYSVLASVKWLTCYFWTVAPNQV